MIRCAKCYRPFESLKKKCCAKCRRRAARAAARRRASARKQVTPAQEPTRGYYTLLEMQSVEVLFIHLNLFGPHGYAPAAHELMASKQARLF